MVCKEELCTWFKNLSPHKRIDFMCGMLNMCLPMELRFMGSYVEDLAKKDFHHLRESESKANSRQELSNFNEKDGKTFRTKMAIYLALLHSSNRTCSNIIFQLLENNIKEAFTVVENMNEMTIHNILLVLSMAMNHPAFSYHQKSKMYEYYKSAIEATKLVDPAQRIFKPDPELFQPRMLSCETRLYDNDVSPTYSPQPPVHLNYSPVVTNKVHVCDIKVKGSRVKEAEKRTVEYRLHVTWSNGEETEVYKTYQELEDFHNQLMQKFPEEARYLTQTLTLPDIQGLVNHTKENMSLLNEYTRTLSRLPTHLMTCSLFISFFVGGKVMSSSPPVQMMDASTSPRPQSVPQSDLPALNHLANSGEDDPVIMPYLNKSQPAVYSTYLHQSPAPGPPSLSSHGLDHPGLNVNATLIHSPSCSTKTTSPLISSPCRSSASSLESPPPSHPTSPGLADREAGAGTLGRVPGPGLPQYSDQYGPGTEQQPTSLRLEDPEDMNSKEMASMKNVIEPKLREKLTPVHLPNGLLDHQVMWGPHQPGAHHPFLPAPGAMAPFPYPPPLQQVFSYPVGYPGAGAGIPPGVAAVARNFSPSNSLNSSPSPSPSSSEESEKEKNSSQITLNGREKGHSAPNSARCGRQVKTTEDGNLPAGNENGNSLQGQGHSGYTSDPTYNATRPQVIRPSYKAQPAHTNVNLPQKFLMHMPESGFKPGGSVVPFPIPHVSMTSSGNHGYSISDNTGPRHLVYFPGAPSLINRSYPINPMNGSRQIYSNGVLQTNPTINHTLTSTSMAQSNANGNSGKMYQGSTVRHPTPPSTAGPQLAGMPKPNVIMNGNDSNTPGPPPVEMCSHRAGSSSSVPSTTTVTYSSATGNQSGNHTICTHCGCSGTGNHPTLSQQPVFPYAAVPPQVGQGMWHPYSNGLVPMHHPMFLHPGHYPNGLNQELVYNAPFGIMNAGNQGVGVPGMYSCSLYNQGPHNNSAGGYPKKPKKPNCHNCGSSKHMAGECNEVSMEAMSGQSMYSYKPKSDSE